MKLQIPVLLSTEYIQGVPANMLQTSRGCHVHLGDSESLMNTGSGTLS